MFFFVFEKEVYRLCPPQLIITKIELEELDKHEHVLINHMW